MIYFMYNRCQIVDNLCITLNIPVLDYFFCGNYIFGSRLRRFPNKIITFTLILLLTICG